MTIGEICNREVVIATAEESIREAARRMREHHVGDLIVVNKGPNGPTPVGILSDRDVVVGVLAADVPCDAVTVGDVMSGDLLTARETDDLLDTVKLMQQHGVRRTPVVDDGGILCGILAVDDLIELIAEQLSDLVALVRSQLRHEHQRRSG